MDDYISLFLYPIRLRFLTFCLCIPFINDACFKRKQFHYFVQKDKERKKTTKTTDTNLQSCTAQAAVMRQKKNFMRRLSCNFLSVLDHVPLD